MEVQEVVRGAGDFDHGASSCSNVLDQHVANVRESENLGVDLLEDLDSYLEDIHDRLTISRMVSDSVIKGMVKAVETMAAEKIASKELKVASLKKMMHFRRLGDEKSMVSGSLVGYHEARSEKNGLNYQISDILLEHDKIGDTLRNLTSIAREHISELKKEIDCRRDYSSMRGVSASKESVDLADILQENESKSLVGVHKMIDIFEGTLETMCTEVNDMVHLSKESIYRCWQEQEFQRELEDMVIRTTIRTLCEAFEEKLWDHNARLCNSQSVDWFEKNNEVSNVRNALDSILKALTNFETGQLTSHGSNDMDHFHHKTLGNHVSTSSLWAKNGESEEFKSGMPENWDAAQLKHMKTEELVNYFNSIITNMRRNHESKVQQLTDNYFSLKGAYLKEKGSSLPLRKDKELDIMRKKIPEVILKLDDILVENKKLSFSKDAETFSSLKDRVDSLLLENHQLRDLLSDKKKELKILSLQVSDASEKMLQHSLAEENLLKWIGSLKTDVDADIKDSVIEEVYKCILTELTLHKNNNGEELEMQSVRLQKVHEVLCSGAAQDAKATRKCEIEDSDVDSLVMQGLCEVIFREAIKDAKSIIDDLTVKYLHESESRIFLESKALEREEELTLLIEEKERLKQEVDLLVAALEEKDMVGVVLSTALTEEMEQLEIASHETNDLKHHESRLQTSLNERDQELDLIKGKLAGALEQVQLVNMDMNKADQKLQLMAKELREANEQRNMLHGVAQKRQNDIVVLVMKDNEQRRQMQSVIVLVHGFSRAFSELECRVAEDIKKNNLRLEEFCSLLQSFLKKTNVFKRTASVYKKKFERRCVDLQTAEAEVDLLGDQVDTLLNLLERIYIGLDHYSPILQHYPGIMEILKLVRRELTGESVKVI